MSGFGLDALAFAPHPDDVEIFCGGVMIRLAELGHSTGVVDLTRGEAASRGTPEMRAAEAAAAARVMALAVRENLGLPDTGLDPHSREQAEAVASVLRRLRPELVLVPWIEERHPDHVAAAALLSRAIFLAGLARSGTGEPSERFVPRQVLHYEMRHRMTPSFIVDTSSVQPRKLDAIACHASQLQARPGEPQTLIGSSRAVEAIDARDRFRGSMIGTSHGEALRAVAVPGLVDPVRHFRDNPFAQAHAFEPLA